MFFAAHLNVVVVAILLYCSWRLATCQLSKLVKANRTKFEKDSGEELGGGEYAGRYVLLSPRQLKQHKSDKRANMSAQMMTIAITEHYRMKLGPEQTAVTIDKWQVATVELKKQKHKYGNEKIDIETEL